MKQVIIHRALASVFDKQDLASVVKPLARAGVKFISTGGTYKAIESEKASVIDVSTHTGFPEMMDGRLKTLHPKIHGGLLAVRSNAKHVQAMQKHDIEGIELVIVNFYPFEKKVAEGASHEEIIENIDIGGPAMVRSAAKNHADVVVLTSPKQYKPFLDEYKNLGGLTSLEFREYMAKEAWSYVARYDQAIDDYFSGHLIKKYAYRKNE